MRLISIMTANDIELCSRCEKFKGVFGGEIFGHEPLPVISWGVAPGY